MKRFERVKQVLEEAVEGQTILAHGNFWRDLTIDQFKVKRIFGKQLVEVGNAQESNLVKALEGRAPFGSDIGTPGAIFNRMPDGFPPVLPEKINIIRKWIDDGCPDEEEASEGEVENREQRLIRYNAYWRDFDNWSLFNRTPEIDDAINEFFPVAEIWMAAARREIPWSDWQAAISAQPVRDAVSLLGSRILGTIQAHYGTPANPDELLESYGLFGANKLPDDALRPDDPRHNMNGAVMWFFFSAYLDASLRLNAPAEPQETAKLGRAIIAGLLNDGLFRNRFRVTGFTPDEEGAAAVIAFAGALSETELLTQLALRFVESQDTDPAPADTRIVELMGVPAESHDINWLEDSLQAALKLELSTIPPYLCALWSIIEPDPDVESYAYKSIKAIAVDEMRHMGLVCNMLTTLGFTPRINTPDGVPAYPGPLPGGVNPTLNVGLKALSKGQLEVFLEIEKPDHPPIMPVEALGEEFPTIGAFYDAIMEAFKRLPAEAFKNERQLTAGGLFRIVDISKVEKAINDVIKRQGEGTEQSPEDEEGLTEPDLAHYYRFRELFWERRFIKNAAGQWVNGDPLPLPAVYEMADIPAGGYVESRTFDLLYTTLLNSLQKAWEDGDNAVLGEAIYGLMFELKSEAQALMQTPIDPQDPEKGNFGPSFLLISEQVNKVWKGETLMAKIEHLKIHPSIGVARIGNHPTEYYLGPELPNGYIKPADIGDFKVADGDELKIKRQGARFRVFAYFDDGEVKELNSENAEIVWRVKIANTKARSGGFYGKNSQPDALRNAFVVDEADRKPLGLEPPEIEISGANLSKAFKKVKFQVKDTDGTLLSSEGILLGECRTDENGRLIVLGGNGDTGSVKEHTLEEYDDNDYWYDDIADGYVKAHVKILETGEEFEAADAWVLCAPPRYVPELRTIVTLYDALYTKHWNEGRIQPDPRPKFYSDVYPILKSAENVPHLHEMGAHSSLGALLKPNSSLPARKRLYDKLRKPDGAGGAGANMPKMFGDGYGSGSQERLILTSYQRLVLSQWKDGDVEIDDIQNSLPATDITPGGLDRAALENCIGGAFYPGIEASWFLRDHYRFVEPFRLDTTQINPGDVSKQMALPWQADFLACSKTQRADGMIAWWVFARPDDVFFEGADEMHPWTPGDEFRRYEDMVEKWMKLGFVVEKDGKYVEVQRQIPPEPPVV